MASTLLTADVTALTTTVEALRARIDAVLSDIRTASTRGYQTFHVDALGGSDDDERSGREDEPLKTVEEALRRTPEGASAAIVLSGATTMTERVFKPLGAIHFRGGSASGRPSLSALGRATNSPVEGQGFVAGIHGQADLTVTMTANLLRRPRENHGGRPDRDRAIFSANNDLAIRLPGTSVLANAGANTLVGHAGGQVSIYGGTATTEDGTTYAFADTADSHGFYLGNVPAGVAIHNSVRRFSNVPNGS